MADEPAVKPNRSNRSNGTARPASRTASAATVERLEDRQLMSVVALAGRDTLIFLSPEAPERTLAKVRVRGLQRREALVGIDFFPGTGQLYGLGDGSRLYRIDPTTGRATAVAAEPFAPALGGAAVGFDFDAPTGLARVVTDADVNFRLDPATGQVVDFAPDTPGVQTDLALNYAPGDPNAGANPSVGAVGIDAASGGGAVATTAYAIDSDANALVRLGSENGSPDAPSTGRLTTIGPLGVDATATVGFDVAVSGFLETGYAALATSDREPSGLYLVNLSDGSATLRGPIAGSKRPVRDLAVAPDGELILMVDAKNRITLIDSNLPNIPLAGGRVNGLARGEKVIGVDLPSGGGARAFTNQNRMYQANDLTGAAVPVGEPTAGVALSRRGSAGFDFDPVANVFRVVTTAGENLRVDPATGQIIDADPAMAGVQFDGPLVYPSGDSNAARRPQVSAIASPVPSAATPAAIVYGIDAAADALVTIGSAGRTTPPESGQVLTAGPLGVDVKDAAGFDIVTRGTTAAPRVLAFAAFTPRGGKPGLYRIDLTTGAATLTGLLPKGLSPVGLTVTERAQ